MYLIAAESRSADLGAGVGYVNQLRSHRGVSNLTALTRDVLQYEYIRELYGEGQLFYMYKRMYAPVIVSTVASRNPAPSAAMFVLPLPSSETDN